MKQLSEDEVCGRKVLHCPEYAVELYRRWMNKNKVPYEERLCEASECSGNICFLIPRKCRPHNWKIE